MAEPQVPLRGTALLQGVRDILIQNPERHDQSTWVGNVFMSKVIDLSERVKVPVDEIRAHMREPFPDEPADSSTPAPACGTTGCALGWAAILAAPAGSYVTNGRVCFPNGESDYMPDWVAPLMGFTPAEASFVFSPSRTREQLIDILNARIADPAADIREIVYPTRSYLGE